jgi:hypothetical protein
MEMVGNLLLLIADNYWHCFILFFFQWTTWCNCVEEIGLFCEWLNGTLFRICPAESPSWG